MSPFSEVKECVCLGMSAAVTSCPAHCGSHSGDIHLTKLSMIEDFFDVDREAKAALSYQRKHRKCPWCEVIETERKGPRRCFENESFIAFAPYASRFAFEIAIFPKKHLYSLAEVDEKGLQDLAEILKKILLKLKGLNAPYNLYLHESPKGKKLHFHFKINPRLLHRKLLREYLPLIRRRY